MNDPSVVLGRTGITRAPEGVRTARSYDLLARWAAEAPDKFGIGLDGRWITYAEWHERVQDRAVSVRDEGVSPVALAYDGVDGIEFAVSYVASHAAARPALVLNPRLPAHTLQMQIDLAGAGTVLSGSREDLAPAAVPRPAPLLDQWGETIAEITFSSGTTGEPKGILISHWGLNWAGDTENEFMWGARQSLELPGEPLGPNDTLVSAFQVGSAMTTNGFLNCGLAVGARMHFLPKFNGTVFTRFMKEVDATAFLGGPVHLALWRQAEPDAEPSARVYVVGGQETHQVDTAWFLERRGSAHLVNAYGLTESCAGITLAVDEEIARGAGAIGQPVDGVEVRLVGPDGEDVDTEGELAMSCFGLMEGYLDRPDLTAAKIRDGWLYTGDIVERRDGAYFVRGRIGDRINRGGNKFDPLEVEEVAAAVPGVTGVVACAIPHPVLGEDVALAVEIADAYDIDEVRETVARKLGRELPQFKVPRDIRGVRLLPRASLDKPQRAAVAAWFRNSEALDGPDPITKLR